jgi:uncharacterized protein (DUF433 family)
MKLFKRITVDANELGGVPCIRGLRIPVATVVGMISEGMPESEILKAYPDLELEDIREALRYAAEAVRERELPVVGPRNSSRQCTIALNCRGPSIRWA